MGNEEIFVWWISVFLFGACFFMRHPEVIHYTKIASKWGLLRLLTVSIPNEYKSLSKKKNLGGNHENLTEGLNFLQKKNR